MGRVVLIGLLAGCASDAVPVVSIEGVDGVPEIFWDGRNVEVLNVDQDGEGWFTLAPANPSDRCDNLLNGVQGVVWGAWPTGYRTVAFDEPDRPLAIPTQLGNGDYTVGVAECVSAAGGVRSYAQDAVARFSIVDGEVIQTE